MTTGTVRGATALHTNLDNRGAHVDEYALNSVIRDLVASTEREVISATAGAEAVDVIKVAIQLQEADSSTSKSQARTLTCSLVDAAMEPSAAAAFTQAETGAGSEVSTTAKARLQILTSAAGVAEVSVTDVAGGSGATIYMLVEGWGFDCVPVIVPITFD